jgi:UDP:flavonoid glycosyltransferase YjiC (YdhE family)
MKIGMQTWGSHGDIRPFLALAEGLQAAGNEVHLMITCVDSGDYGSIKSAHGVKITMIASPVLSPDQQEDYGRAAYGIRNPFKQMETILAMCFAPVEDIMFDAARRLAADADVLIGHFFMHPLQIAAERAGKPYVSVVLSQVVIPSDFYYPLGLPLGTVGHRLLWRLTRHLLHRAVGHYPNRLRRKLGMPPVTDLMTEVWLSRHLTLVAVSPQLCQPQPDWPASVRVCGFLDTPNLDIEGRVPENLAAFLRAGEAPVYMTFGSWMPKDAPGQTKALRLLTQAARKAGCRAIIQSHAAQACGFTSDDQILYVAAAPHQAIFPHCRAVVHHGGAGTTQSTTLAGKPSIVVANISEQEHWGLELRRLGLAGKPAGRRSVTAVGLARRIRRVLDSPDMAVKAEGIGRAMRKEDGVSEAAKLIMEQFSAQKENIERNVHEAALLEQFALDSAAAVPGASLAG